MKRWWLVCSVMLLTLAAALPASTQTKDVLVNGGFEIDLAGWSAPAGTLIHTTTTTHGGSAGAAQLTWDAPGWANAYQCVDLSGELGDWPEDGGQKYVTFDGYFLSGDGISETSLSIQFYNNADCTSVSEHTTSPLAVGSGWTYRTATATIPATAQSVRFYFATVYTGAGIIYADDLAAYSSTITAVQSQGMAVSNGLWASVGFAGVAVVGSVVSLVRRKKAS